MAKRNDLGAPVDGYFTQQPPFYQRNGKSVCSLAAFKEHVGINFFAPPTVLVDPGRKLEGGGKSMRMLKVRSAQDIDSANILRWLKATVAANSA